MMRLREPMRPNTPDLPFPLAYLLALAFQIPVWLCAGLLFAALVTVLDGSPPLHAFAGGLVWGFFMWAIVGNLFAVGLAWRRSAEFPAPDRTAFRLALGRACRKLRLVVLAESADEIVLGSKCGLARLRLWDVRVELAGGAAVLTAPAISFGAIRKALGRALAEAPAGAPEASQDGKGAGPAATADGG
jgi:hypothetical protein